LTVKNSLGSNWPERTPTLNIEWGQIDPKGNRRVNTVSPLHIRERSHTRVPRRLDQSSRWSEARNFPPRRSREQTDGEKGTRGNRRMERRRGGRHEVLLVSAPIIMFRVLWQSEEAEKVVFLSETCSPDSGRRYKHIYSVILREQQVNAVGGIDCQEAQVSASLWK